MTSQATLLARLAVRNLRRQARRTALTAAAMIVGGVLLVFSLSLGDGAHEDWIEAGVRLGSGHIAIQAPGFQRRPRIENRLPASARRAAEGALALPGVAEHVVHAVPRLVTSGLASSAAAARPVQVLGVDPIPEGEFSMLDDRVVSGRYLEPGDRLAAYLGAGLAEGLDLELGSRFVLTAQDATGEISGQLVRVVGIFRTGIPEVDQALVHIPLSTAGGWLRVGDDVSTLAVLLDSSYRVRPVRRALERALTEDVGGGSVAVLSWRQAMPELDAAVRIDDYGNYLFQGILFAIIALGIVNTILMSVMYRRREFGLMQALGLTPGQTGILVLVEGWILTAISGLIGIGLGLFLTWFFWREGLDLSFAWSDDLTFSGVILEPVLVPLFRLARILQGLAFILAIGTIASLYPAIRATRIEVADAMKFER